MGRVFVGEYNGSKKKFTIIVSRFNEFITKHLLESCMDTLLRHGVKQKNIDIVWVPGAFEIPLALKKIVQRKKQSAVICLGCIIKGETPHFEYIANHSARGIAEISRRSAIPVSFGVITANNLEQAIERAGAKMGNKGADAALTALEMVNLIKKF